MKRLLIALFALSSLLGQAQTIETVPNWTSKAWYFRPDAQNPKRIPKSYLTGNYAPPVTSSYTTKGEADVAVGGGSTLTITLGQSTEAVQGKSILIYDYTGNRSTGNYIRVQSHSPSTVKIDGEDYYDINTVGGWVEIYFDGSNYKVRDSNIRLDGDVLLVQNGTIRAYKTIQLANSAAVAGGTIVLLKDLTLTAGLALTSGVSIDGNGKSITIGGSGTVDLFWVQSGISKIYNFKRIESTRTGSAARWLFACFGENSKMYVDVDEIKVLDGCVALAGNDGSKLTINARKVDLGTYNASAGLNNRKFLSNNGAYIKVTGATITDAKVISEASGFVGSVLYSGQELAQAGDTLRSVLEFENVEFDVSRGIALVERMGELRMKNIKAKTLAKTAISMAGDPYTSNASLMRHYNKAILTDCEFLGGNITQGIYFTSLISVTSDNTQGFETNFQDIYCFGTNYFNTNTTNSFYNNASRYGIKNYGTIIYNGPIVGETFIYNQPIPLGATLVGGGSITSVGLSMPAAFNVTGSPITTSGTFGVTGAGTTAQYMRGDASLSTFATDVATTGNALYAQLSGSYANPTWITSLTWSKISGTPTTLSGYNITDGVSTSGSYANPSWITSLAASKISSILSIPQGGTGAATQAAALTALLPTQTGNSGKVLQTDGTNATWQTAGNFGDAISLVTIGTQSTSKSLFKINADAGFGAVDLFQVFANGDVLFKNRFGANIFRYLATEDYINATSTSFRTGAIYSNISVYSPIYGGSSYQDRNIKFDESGVSMLLSTARAADKMLVVKGYTSHTGNLTEWQNSSGTALSYVNNVGALNIGATTASTSTTTGSATFGGGIGVAGQVTTGGLEVISTTKGTIPGPKMTTTQRDAIASPTAGLHIFNTTTNQPNWYDGSTWTGVGNVKIAKQADESVTSSATLQDDNHLTFAMAANTNYNIQMKIFYNATASPGFKWAITGGASPTAVITEYQYRSGASGAAIQGNFQTATYPTVPMSGDDTTDIAYLIIECNVQNVNAGSFKFQFCQATSHGESVTVKKGSYLTYSTY